jgi:hypothetical protein
MSRSSPGIFADLTPQAACDALASAGFACSPGEIEILAREERWAVRLPGWRMAWFPASAAGRDRLAVERRVLALLSERCAFRVPHPVLVSTLGVDIRAMVPGRCDPWALFHRCKADAALARSVGRSIGSMLAEQHTAIREADVAGWLPRQPAWPEPAGWIMERLPQVIDDRALLRGAESVVTRYAAEPVGAGDCALLHGDVGLHNLALDPASDTVVGIFDYGDAAWADRHHDFRYLPFDVGREDMLDAALEVYEPAAGCRLDRGRIRLYNAACAASYLALRVGVAAGETSCGRTLAEDLHWLRAAMTALD